MEIETYEKAELGHVDRYTVRDKIDHTIIVKVLKYETLFNGGQFSETPGPAIFVHVCDLSEKNAETGKAGAVYANVCWMGGSLIGDDGKGLKGLLDKRGAGATTAVTTGRQRGKNGFFYGTLNPLDADKLARVQKWIATNPDPFDGIVAADAVPELDDAEDFASLDDTLAAAPTNDEDAF